MRNIVHTSRKRLNMVFLNRCIGNVNANVNDYRAIVVG